MSTLRAHGRDGSRMEKFNGPILDHEKLREGTLVAGLTALASIGLVLVVKGLYLIF